MKRIIAIGLMLMLPAAVLAANKSTDQKTDKVETVKSTDYYHDYNTGNYVKAKPALEEGVAKDDKKSMFYLGKMYMLGYGVEKDSTKGLSLILKSADKNFEPAQMYLAEYYLHKMNDVKLAMPWFEKAADNGNLRAQLFCGMSYLRGYGVKYDFKQAWHFLELAAKKGNVNAQYELALLLYKSEYRSNHKLGFNWMVKAAEAGDVEAQYQVGKAFEQGKIVYKEIPKAIKWYTVAADNGSTKSAAALAMLYQKNPKEENANQLALEWYQKASDKGDHKAQYQLAKIYLKPDTDIHNPKKAVELMILASKGGYEKAQIALARMYLKGDVVSKNEKEAFKLFLAMAEHGNVNAMRKVGIMYYEGIGVTRNKDDALKWLNKAKAQGDIISKYKIDAIKTDWGNVKDHNEARFISSPKMVAVKKSEIFQPEYSFTNPYNIPTEEFVRVLARNSYLEKNSKIILPRYQVKTDKDPEKLFKTIERDARHGYAPSQFQLSLMYENGIGTEKNLELASKWLKESVRQRYLKADYTLGLNYLEGKGVKSDYKKGLFYIKKAALKGDVYAEYTLGVLFENGLGNKDSENYIARDLNQAKDMYGLAASKGFGLAQYNLAMLYAGGAVSQHVSAFKKYHDVTLELLQKATNNNVAAANLMLAYYYVLPKTDEQKQKWAFNIAKQDAEMGNPNAMFLLALMYDRGIGVKAERNDAINWYKKAADKNNSVAEFTLGSYYYLGDGVSKNPHLASELLQTALKQGFPYATYNLAIIAHNDRKDNAKFLELLRKASEAHYAKASLLLADYYLSELGGNENIKQAGKIYEDAAKRGNAKAELKLGYMHENGIYYTKNYQVAKQWYQLAAEQNDKVALYLLGMIYQSGKGTHRNINKAIALYEKAAKQKFIPAQVALGFVYETYKQNYELALRWFSIAAHEGNPVAEYNLGLMYQYGKGVPIDMKKAFNSIKKSASQGYSNAEFAFANMYRLGLGTRKSHYRAMQWYEKAAKQGNYYALQQLGQIYENGHGGESVNVQKANYYFEQANKMTGYKIE